MIDIINVEQTFGDRRILKNVNLQINKGETMVILGASGSGKSTLLKMMIGLLKPTSGKILIDGRDITKMPETELNEQSLRLIRRSRKNFIWWDLMEQKN